MKINLQNVALVFLGGAIGTAARYGVSIALPQIGMLFAVNLLGAAFLGVVNASSIFESGNSKAFWGVGFAGGFTTMSGVALWVIGSSDAAAFAPLTVIAMFALGVLAYLLGLRLGARLGKPRAEVTE
jgi:CrcB protein